MRLALYTVGGLLDVALLVPLLRVPSTASAVAQAPTGPTVPAPSPTETTKRFKLRLTLSTPTDLKVREGDRIAAGQILADRAHDRQRLDY
jgi:biotin carboxyl carrier protein